MHSILNRVGRKIPYCVFSILFCLVAFSILLVQNFMEKDGRGLFSHRCLWHRCCLLHICSSNNYSEYHPRIVEVSRFGILREYLYLCQRTFPNQCEKYRHGYLFDDRTCGCHHRYLLQWLSGMNSSCLSSLSFILFINRILDQDPNMDPSADIALRNSLFDCSCPRSDVSRNIE